MNRDDDASKIPTYEPKLDPKAEAPTALVEKPVAPTPAPRPAAPHRAQHSPTTRPTPTAPAAPVRVEVDGVVID